MEIGIYGLFTEDGLGVLRGVFWACHRGVDQPIVGSATVLSWNFWSLWPRPTLLWPLPGLNLAAPPCPRAGNVSVTSNPLQSVVWAFKETFPYPELVE